MGFESTMICVDTSDYMRNGDFVPTRLQAQQDAAYMVCRSKSRGHPENDVGLLVMAGVKVLVTLTTDVEKILVTLHKLSPEGVLDFQRSLMVAQLALKHRQEKRHKMRIVAFVGSPINLTEEELVSLAKKLRKLNVSVDVVSFGAEAEIANKTLLEPFIDTLNGKDGKSSNLLIVTSGPFLTGALVSSPILLGEDGLNALPGDEYDWDVDADEDPELALALKMSLAEQRQNEAQATSSPPQISNEDTSGVAASQDPLHFTEEEQIAYAIQLSMAERPKPSEDRNDLSEEPPDEEHDQKHNKNGNS